MSSIADAIQDKCMSFADRIIKLNDYLLDQAANKMYDGGRKKYDGKSHQTSNIKRHTSHVPVYLQSVSNLCNQLLRAGTSIGANRSNLFAHSRRVLRMLKHVMLLVKQISNLKVSLR